MAEVKQRLKFSAAWLEARELVWAHRRRLAIGLVLILISRLAGMVLPTTSKYLIDDVIKGHRPELLPVLALAAGVATVVQAITGFCLSQVLGVAAQRAINQMRESVQAHVLRLPVRFFDGTTSGKLVARVMNDAEGVRNLVGTGLVELLGSMITALLAVSVLLVLNWWLTVLVLLVLIAFGAAMALAFKQLRPIFRERSVIYSEVTGRLSEGLGGIRTVKSYTAELRESQVFVGGVGRLFQNIRRSMTGVSLIGSGSTIVLGVVGVMMMTVGGRAILAGTMTLGDFVMYMVFTGLVAAPLVGIASIGTQITDALAGLDRIRELKRMITEDDGDAARAALPEVRGELRFEHVWFEYHAGVPVLKDVSLSAPAGSTTALVGPSGSGKSTLIGLVMAFHQPQRGRVLVDGVDLASVRLRDYRAHLGAVLQENFLFDGTIAANIAYGRPDASPEAIRAASRVAHCDEFIDRFEQGYDTVVGERGIKLSGGQRQRVAIARAILARPAILILDEATSSLDSESEAAIQDGLKSLRRGRTTFVIAHRLSTIMSADQILVVEGGEIIERGTHAQLLARDGRYRQLYEKQFRIERNRFVNPGEELALERNGWPSPPG
ncbi:MAG: ABC transporter ATP-binding protein [Planctomycetota bacterium]